MEKENIQTQAQFDNYDIKLQQINKQTNTYFSYILLNKKERIKKKLNKKYVPKYNENYSKFMDNLFELCTSSRNKGMVVLSNNFKKDELFLSRLYYELFIQWGINIEKPLSYQNEDDKVTIELVEVFVNKLLKEMIVTSNKNTSYNH